MMELKLSEPQQRAVATALTLLSVVFIVAVLSFAAWWLGRFLFYFSNVFMPIAVAGIAAMVMKPFHDWLYERVGRRALVSVLLVYLAVLIPLIAFSWFFGALLLEQMSGLLGKAGGLVQQGWAVLMKHWPEIMDYAKTHDLDTHIQTALEERMDIISAGVWTLLQTLLTAGANVFRFVAGLLSWFIFPIYLGFFLSVKSPRARQIEGLLPFLKPETRSALIYLGTEFVHILVSFFRGQLLVALFQGLLYAAGFSIIGLQYGFALGMLLGLLNIVPYLGSIIGLAITIPLGLFQPEGGISMAVMVIAAFTVVQLIESYVLTPQIMGDRTGLHPLVIIVAIFFWGTAFGGIWGMIMAIPLTAFLVVFWRLLKEKYIREVV